MAVKKYGTEAYFDDIKKHTGSEISQELTDFTEGLTSTEVDTPQLTADNIDVVDITTSGDVIYSDTFWDDLRFPAEGTKKITGKEPVDTVYKGGLILEFEDNASQAVAFNVQLPHGKKDGTDMDAHIHVILPVAGSGAGTENMKFDITYAWAAIGGKMPTTETTITATIDIQNLLADTHYLWDIGDILYSNMQGTAVDGSSMLICSFQRDHTVTDNSTKHVYLMEIDFHYEIDKPGSNNEIPS